MIILTQQLPSGGYGYGFPSVVINPMNFMEICNYLENVPKDPLEKYLFDINFLEKDDKRILDCYVMDVDFLIFYKKLITVSSDLTYNLTVKCPVCGEEIKKKISLEKDIHFNQIDQKIMNGAIIELNSHKYETFVPTLRDFLKVFEKYLVYKKTEDLGIIKTIALIKGFDLNANQIERDVLGATHNDITLLMALRDLYYNRLDPVNVYCPHCIKEEGERREPVAVSVNSLIVDFFRDLCINSPIDGSKVLFQ